MYQHYAFVTETIKQADRGRILGRILLAGYHRC